MPSPYDGTGSSGVGDNAFGRMRGGAGLGSGRGRGSMFANNRQMKQYMQMRRDEMSHGAWLANQNDSLSSERGEGRTQREADRQFNRDSLRADADTATNDWQKTRNTFHTSEVRKTDPNITGYKTDGPSFSFSAEPGLNPQGRAAQERFQEMKDTGFPFSGGGPSKGPDGPRPVSSERVLPGSPSRPELEAPSAKSRARAPRAKREPGFVQQTLPGMRGTRQFKDTTLSPSTGSAATSTPIASTPIK